MGSCSRRHFLLSICFLQLLFIIERQVFDFLGYMWAPILANFFHIIFVIFGLFGAYQYRPKYLVTYSLWNLLWIGWNAFLICFYLNAGVLDRDSDLLNLGTGSVSWFEVNGYGCKPTYPMNITSEDPYRPVRPERVDGCLLDYHIVEIVQSSLQCALALLGFFGAVCLGHTYLDEDDSFDFMGGDAKSPQHTAVHPMYVSYTSLPTTNSATSTQLKQASAANAAAKSPAQTAIINSTVISANKHNNSGNHCLNNTSAKLGVVLMSINGHGNRNANSSSNTNTLLSSSSSPSSTFTNCNGNGSSSISGSGCNPPVGGLTTHEAHIPLHQQPMPHLRPLSRNSSFSKTRSGQIRKNSSSASIRYTDVIQQQQQQHQQQHQQQEDEQKIIPNDDDTFFIPKSSSCRNNFGISNPFNNVSSRYYRDGDGDSRADDDDNTRLITGSLQQLSLSTPLKRNPSITSNGGTVSGGTGNDINTTTTPNSEKNSIAFDRNFPHGTRPDASTNQHRIGYKAFQSVQPAPPPVPPLPQLHLQHHQFDSTENYRMPYQYITRSPNLNRIARRNNSNLVNNNNSSGSSSRVMSPKYCDQIRELGGPPSYHGHENNNYPAPPSAVSPINGAAGAGYPAMVMHRAKSQDRLSHRSRRHHGGGARGQHGAQQQQRPRSFCSNNGIYPDYVIMEHPDTNRNSKKSKHRQSLYSIEFSRPVDAIRGAHDDDDLRGPSLSPKPMTPRRVKRRSVMQRGTTNRQSTTSRRSHSNTRSSARNSRRKIHQNPVTKLMNQQSAGTMTLTKTFPQFVHNKNSELTESNLKSLNNDYIMSQSTASMLNNFSKMGSNNLNTFNHPPRHNTHTPTLPDGSPIDPIYYNMNSSSPLLQQQTSWASSNPGGHSNPTYQHSTSNLNHSPELNDDYYTNNRPPSVRSSYSNFHGARPLSSYATAGGNLNITQPGGTTAENMFASLTNQQQQQINAQQQQQQQPPQQQQQHQQQQQQQLLSTVTDPLSVPQLPHRRSVSRESLRAMQFLNSGPPAYNLNYHTPPDSETTM